MSVDKLIQFKNPMLKVGHAFLILSIIIAIIFFLIGIDPFLYLFVGFIVVMGLTMYLTYGLAYITFKTNYSKAFKKYDKQLLNAELNDPSMLTFGDTFFTKNFIISQNYGNLFIAKYSELLWVFCIDMKQDGVILAKRFFGYTVGNRLRQIIIANAFNDNNALQIYQLIKSRNPNVIIGYSKENKEAYKKLLR